MKSKDQSPISNRNLNEIIAQFRGERIAVGEFIAKSTALAECLPKHDFVLNLLSDRYQYLVAFCASVIAGQCTLMPPNRLASTLEKFKQTYTDLYTLDDSLYCELMGGQDCQSAEQHQVRHIEIPEIPLNQLCAIAFTSGSTGEPTPNLKYWKTIRDGSIGNSELLFAGEHELINLLVTVPPQHMWGFETSILLPLFANVCVSHRTPFYPQDIVDALKSLPTPRALVSSPVHLSALIRANVKPTRVKQIFSATAPISKSLSIQLESHFNAQFIEIFGSSESGILARRLTASETLWKLSSLFQLTPCDGNTLVKASHLPSDVLLTDHIELADKNHFNWLGRDQDMINIAGKRGSLTDLNQQILAIEGVNDCVIFSQKENKGRLAAMVVAPGMNAADITRQLRTCVEPVFLPRPLYLVPALPRLETGKLPRKEFMALFEDLNR